MHSFSRSRATRRIVAGDWLDAPVVAAVDLGLGLNLNGPTATVAARREHASTARVFGKVSCSRSSVVMRFSAFVCAASPPLAFVIKATPNETRLSRTRRIRQNWACHNPLHSISSVRCSCLSTSLAIVAPKACPNGRCPESGAFTALRRRGGESDSSGRFGLNIRWRPV